jgi:hypothetical protein
MAQMTAFGPETVKAMGQAFDQAWTEIAGNFGDSRLEVERARQRLAKAMLSVATEGSTDVAVLKAGAINEMALYYRSGIRPTVRNAN